MMRPETKRRVLFVFGVAVWGCVAMLAGGSSAFAQENDAPRMTGPNVRARQWVKSDPLADNTMRPDVPTPVIKATPMGDTVSVHSLQLSAGAIKEFHRSEKCVGSGDYSCAAQHLQKALRADPKFVEAHNNLGASYLELSRYQDAIAEFEAAIALDEKLVAPYRNMSLGFFLMRRYVDAEAAARRALAVSPDHKPARYSLGRALAAEGSVSLEAERLLRESLGDFPEARLSLAQVLMNRCANLDAAAELRAYLASNTVDPDTQRRVQVWIERSLKGQAVSGCGQAKPAA
jgi:tetratricopeptide (TPR) repeat protein